MHALDPHVIIFSGGGTRGFLHVGFLRAIHEGRIPISYLDGISIGSWAAAFYGLGYTPDQIEEVAYEFEVTRVLTFRSFLGNLLRHGSNYRGLFDPMVIASEIDRVMGRRTFAQLVHNVRIQATDLKTGQPFVFSRETTPEAPLSLAIAASSALTGVFQPIDYDGRVLVDGSYCGTWMPVDGPVIISNVSPLRVSENLASKPILTLLFRSFSVLGQYMIDEVKRRNPRVLEVQHDARDIGMLARGLSREKRAELMRRSYQVTRAAIDAHLGREAPCLVAVG